MWKPNCWSVYNQLIRTNNDVEGWHSSLNRAAARSNLEFYLLVELLSREVNWRLFNLLYLYIAQNIIVSILRLNWLISNSGLYIMKNSPDAKGGVIDGAKE